MKAKITSFFYRLIGKKKGYCCDECIEHLHDVIDGECCNETNSKFMEHIKHCKCCYEHYEVDKSVKELVKYKVEKKPCPQHLIDQIKNKIHDNE